MQIREVGIVDPDTALDTALEKVLDIRLAFLAEFHDKDPDSWDASFVDATRTYLRTGVRAGTVRCWIAEENDDVLGGVSVLLFDKPPLPNDSRTTTGWVLNMYVRPDTRRCGVGGRLFDACVEAVRDAGARQLVLHATPDGRSLYERRGFQPSPAWMELDLPSR
jgi:GNAT superfamily N-acetyltransferase